MTILNAKAQPSHTPNHHTQQRLTKLADISMRTLTQIKSVVIVIFVGLAASACSSEAPQEEISVAELSAQSLVTEGQEEPGTSLQADSVADASAPQLLEPEPEPEADPTPAARSPREQAAINVRAIGIAATTTLADHIEAQQDEQAQDLADRVCELLGGVAEPEDLMSNTQDMRGYIDEVLGGTDFENPEAVTAAFSVNVGDAYCPDQLERINGLFGEPGEQAPVITHGEDGHTHDKDDAPHSHE